MRLNSCPTCCSDFALLLRGDGKRERLKQAGSSYVMKVCFTTRLHWTSRGTRTSQDAYRPWHIQSTIHALAPFLHVEVLGLQRLRFKARETRARARRTVRKDLRPIAGLLDDIQVPQFCNSVNLDTHYCDFQVAAIILHRGDSINSGHYVCIWKIGTTLLLLDDAFTNHGLGECCWRCMVLFGFGVEARRMVLNASFSVCTHWSPGQRCGSVLLKIFDYIFPKTAVAKRAGQVANLRNACVWAFRVGTWANRGYRVLVYQHKVMRLSSSGAQTSREHTFLTLSCVRSTWTSRPWPVATSFARTHLSSSSSSQGLF